MAPRRSEVWKQFTEVDDDVARCKICLKAVRHAKNTSNLWTHLENKHENFARPSKQSLVRSASAVRSSTQEEAVVDEQVQDDPSTSRTPPPPPQPLAKKARTRQNTIEETFARARSFDEQGEGTARLNKSLLYMISKDNTPINIVEKPGFQHFVKQAVPRYSLPSRTTVTRMLDDQYEILSVRVKDFLAGLDAVTLTSDVWTNTLTTTSYLGITVHYLNGAQMKSATIGLTQLETAHTAENLADAMRTTLASWRIDLDKVRVMVTDNGANMVAATHRLLGRNRHLSCVAHTLNLVAESVLTLDILSELLATIKAIVTFVKRSVKASDMLRKLQLDAGKSEGTVLRLIQSVPTRWNSTYDMCDRFIKLSDLVGVVLLRCNGPAMLSGAELDTLKTVRILLRPLSDATKDLSAEQHTTTSKVIPIVHMMKQAVSDVQTQNNPVLVALKHKLSNELNTRFRHIEEVDSFSIANILDPRFKTLYMGRLPVPYSQAVTKVTNMINRQFTAERLAAAASAEINPAPRVELDQDDEEEATPSLWSMHDSLVASSPTPQPDNPGGVSTAIRQFLNTPVSPRTVDPLQEWDQSLRKEYPQIHPIAMDFLSRVATSVPAERLFSKAGNTATTERNRLTGKRLSKLLFLGSLDKNDWKL